MTKKVTEIVKEQEDNGISNKNKAQAEARKKLIKKVNELSLIDKIVEYIYKQIYDNNVK